MKAYNKDIFRSIKKTRKRFMAIAIIIMLGITVLTGIYATCQDMYYSADRFYDEQQLYDIQVLSTLGLTDEDVAELSNVTGISAADGSYSEVVDTDIDDSIKKAEIIVISKNGMNMPFVNEGVLPEAPGEMAVTSEYIDASGKSIGDTVEIKEIFSQDETGEFEDEEKPNILSTSFKITAVVLNPIDISNSNVNFRSTSTNDFTFFITPEDINSDIYTSIYLRLSEAEELNCYSAEYENIITSAVNKIENEISSQREEARYNTIINEAIAKISDAEQEMNEEFANAEKDINQAWADIEKAKKEITDGEAELTREEADALRELSNARSELEKSRQTLIDSQTQIAESEKELSVGEAALKENHDKLTASQAALDANRKKAEDEFAAAEAMFLSRTAELSGSLSSAQAGAAGLQVSFGDAWPDVQWNALVSSAASQTTAQLAANPNTEPDSAAVFAATANEQADLTEAIAGTGFESLISDTISSAIGLGMINASKDMLASQKSAYQTQKANSLAQLNDAQAQLDYGKQEIDTARATLDAGRIQLENGKAELAAGWDEFEKGEAKLNSEEQSALKELASAWQDIAEGKEELKDGETELTENETEYLSEKADAEEKIAEAYAELDNIDMTKWYIQDRSYLSSFSSMKSDMSSIEAVGNAFPIIFLVVAILISLTTMTRMVEEDRGLIGTYMALGFSNRSIYRKYVIYALLACLLGAILGNVIGFIVLPHVLYVVLKSLYILPGFYLQYSMLYGIGGTLIFTVPILLATVLTCRGEVRHTPASLMRPKAPKAGSRVIFEYIPPIWNRLKFLNKVTVRNLFRYKKRLLMTITGIMGCTALVFAGFAIKDTVTDLMPNQYEDIYHYDLMLVSADEDYEEMLKITEENFQDYVNMRVDSVKILNSAESSETVQLIAVNSESDLEDYVTLKGIDNTDIALSDEGILLTRNCAELLKLDVGDTVTIQTMELDKYEVVLTGIAENYLGNSIYMTKGLYQELFSDYKENALFSHLDNSIENKAQYAVDLLDNEIILSSVSTDALRQDFSANFSLINLVVYLLIVLAAGLAFVVLFTLSSTNISERQRELATIKVLGFFDREVHSYVNKETLILTALGVLCGLPLGYLLSAMLTSVLKMPSIYFAVSVHPISYVIAGVISFSFAVIVDFITNRTLDKVNMVEALKSVE